MRNRQSTVGAVLALLGVALVGVPDARAEGPDQSNILVLWGDDIGWQNVSVDHPGGGRAPDPRERQRGDTP